ncbi:MAG: YIP1 family protein, partial [Myxococcales bacterium]
PRRMLGAALLDEETFEEVEHDRNATRQAALIVAAVAVASGIGGFRAGFSSSLSQLVSQVLGWLLMTFLAYLIGTRLFRATATWGEVLRTVGFAQTPGLFFGFASLSFLVRVGLWMWILVATVVALRQSLDLSEGKTIVTGILCWVAYMAIGVIAWWLFGLRPVMG